MKSVDTLQIGSYRLIKNGIADIKTTVFMTEQTVVVTTVLDETNMWDGDTTIYYSVQTSGELHSNLETKSNSNSDVANRNLYMVMATVILLIILMGLTAQYIHRHMKRHKRMDEVFNITPRHRRKKSLETNATGAAATTVETMQ